MTCAQFDAAGQPCSPGAYPLKHLVYAHACDVLDGGCGAAVGEQCHTKTRAVKSRPTQPHEARWRAHRAAVSSSSSSSPASTPRPDEARTPAFSRPGQLDLELLLRAATPSQVHLAVNTAWPAERRIELLALLAYDQASARIRALPCTECGGGYWQEYADVSCWIPHDDSCEKKGNQA